MAQLMPMHWRKRQAKLAVQKRMLAVVVANATDAQRLLAEIRWFGENAQAPLRCHLLPDWETLPYVAFSPHQDLVSEAPGNPVIEIPAAANAT